MKTSLLFFLVGAIGLGNALNHSEEDHGGSIQDEFAISNRERSRPVSLALAEPGLASTELEALESGHADEVEDRR